MVVVDSAFRGGGFVVELRCVVVRRVDDEPFPGWVEAGFTDAVGHRWSLLDKPSIFAATGGLGPDSAYPVEAAVACVVREGRESPQDGGTVTVSTSPHGVATPDGRDGFTARRNQLVD
ncbi:hypothetical protein ACFRCG_03250 [Embleya sp. NPDC056575]|uniref:hypothetical protein n=1 Tax=unclassified Embleya TaxID=2699296 RepID=UPI0036CE2037